MAQPEGGGELILALSEGARVMLLGAVRLRVLAGEASVLCARLRPGGRAIDVVCPPYECAGWIEASGVTDGRLAASSGRLSCGAALSAALGGARGAGLQVAVVLLTPVPGLDGSLADYALDDVGSGGWDVRGARVWGGEGVLHVTGGAPATPSGGGGRCRVASSCLLLPPSLPALIGAIAAHPPPRPPVIVVLGPKGSGKSTLSRAIANGLVTRPGGGPVGWLDLDPGQPEHGPAGFLSLALVTRPLLCPPRLRAASFRPSTAAPLPPGPSEGEEATFDPAPARVLAARFLGATTVASCLSSYIAAVKSLLSVWEGAGGAAPLLLSAHGWGAGTGGLSLDAACALCAPSHVIRLGCAAPSPSPCIDLPSWHAEGGQDAAPRASRSPADARAARLLPYVLGSPGGEGGGREGLRLTPLGVALAARSDALARAASIVLTAVLNDTRLARTPSGGAASPGHLLRTAVGGVLHPSALHHIALSPAETVPALGGATQGAEEKECRAAALVGTLIALACAWALPPAAGVAGEGSTLPALGLAYVRGWDPRSCTLHIATPLSPSALATVDTLLGWPGSGLEVPSQALVACGGEGDPFVCPPALCVGPGEGAGGRGGGAARKQLKRVRLAR